jgi:2-dehydro-3-deoxy-D-arabinonate dehydratase
MKLYRTSKGIFAEHESSFFLLPIQEWDELVRAERIERKVRDLIARTTPHARNIGGILPPVANQEVWAAGVTYFRSRSARIEESQGAGDFYDRVYAADRPELFFKATGRRVVGPGSGVRIRSDASWSVPEPELTLLINPAGHIIGYTIGNDMSSRDIEGENPLYLPQAKVYDGSCALGPCILLSTEPLSKSTAIALEVIRSGTSAFSGTTTLSEMHRDPRDLANYLFRENTFPDGAFLMTGTGIVPGEEFSLVSGDRIRIAIDGIGILENVVV